MDGNKALEYLQGMSEEERSICQLDWLITPNRAREYVSYEVDSVLFEIDMDDVNKLRNHLIEYVDDHKVSTATADAFVDMNETVVSNYSDEFDDNFRLNLHMMLKEEAQDYIERKKKK
jgi:hypothetical protein